MIDLNATVTELLLNLFLLIVSGLGLAAVGAIKKRVDAQGIEVGLIVAQAAVSAIEQVGARYGWTPEQKLNAALGEARRLAESYGLKLTDEQWKVLIEQGVAELKRAGAELVKPVNRQSTELKTGPYVQAVLAETGG